MLLKLWNHGTPGLGLTFKYWEISRRPPISELSPCSTHATWLAQRARLGEQKVAVAHRSNLFLSTRQGTTRLFSSEMLNDIASSRQWECATSFLVPMGWGFAFGGAGTQPAVFKNHVTAYISVITNKTTEYNNIEEEKKMLNIGNTVTRRRNLVIQKSSRLPKGKDFCRKIQHPLEKTQDQLHI